MKEHRIAVISDTHGMIRPQVREVLSQAERILHGGDVASQETLDELRRIAPVDAVRGNCDRGWANPLPEELTLKLYGRKVYLVHDQKQVSPAARGADLIIFGHSHQYEERYDGKTLWLNPGSCGPRRPGRPLTLAMLVFEEESGRFAVQRVELSAGKKSAVPPGDDRFGAVAAAVRDLERGKSLDDLVRRGISRTLAEQICQIYFTHPGIDLRGILDRMEIKDL